MTSQQQLRPGAVLTLGRAASVQFVRPIRLSLARIVDHGPTYDGWVWLDGYQLNDAGEAVSRRQVFVAVAGVAVAA